jgi:hypothetical protein
MCQNLDLQFILFYCLFVRVFFLSFSFLFAPFHFFGLVFYYLFPFFQSGFLSPFIFPFFFTPVLSLFFGSYGFISNLSQLA